MSEDPRQFLRLDASAVDGEGKPSRIQIGQYGEYTINGKKINFTRDFFNQIVENFNTHQVAQGQRIVSDYDHFSDDPNATPEQRKAAGWVDADVGGMEVDEHGLWANINFNKDARKYIENDEYSYVSPEIHFNTKDRRTGDGIGPTVQAIAVTNRPFLTGMQPLTLSIPKIEEQNMANEITLKDEVVRHVLKLNDDVEITDEHRESINDRIAQRLGEVDTLTQEIEDLKAQLEASGEDGNEVAALNAQIAKLTSKIDVLSEGVQSGVQAKKTLEVERAERMLLSHTYRGAITKKTSDKYLEKIKASDNIVMTTEMYSDMLDDVPDGKSGINASNGTHGRGGFNPVGNSDADVEKFSATMDKAMEKVTDAEGSPEWSQAWGSALRLATSQHGYEALTKYTQAQNE